MHSGNDDIVDADAIIHDDDAIIDLRVENSRSGNDIPYDNEGFINTDDDILDDDTLDTAAYEVDAGIPVAVTVDNDDVYTYILINDTDSHDAETDVIGNNDADDDDAAIAV